MADSAPQAKKASNNSPKENAAPRSAIKHPLMWTLSFLLLVIIVVAFVVMPINTGFAATNQSIVFGYYDGTEISYKAGNYFASQYDAYKANNGAEGTDNVQAEYSALKQAFDRTVLHTAVIKSVKQLDVSVTDSKIDSQLADNPRFQENGVFSKERFSQINSLDLLNMRNLARDEILQNRVFQDVVNGGVISAKETGFIKEIGRLNRSFEFVAFTNADYPDSEVQKYATANSQLFKSLEVSVFTVTKKTDADNYRQQILDNKTTFENTAKNYSIDTYKGSSGVRGAVSYHELKIDLDKGELADQVFALKKGALSAVLAVPNGFAIYRADSDVKEFDLTNPSNLKTVRDYLVANQKGIIEDYLQATAKDFSVVARKDGLEKASKVANKKVELTNSFPINYGGILFPTMYGNYPIMASPGSADNKALSNASDKEDFFTKAFSLKKDEISAPILLSDEILILKLKEEKLLDEAALGLFANFASSLAQYFVNVDMQASIVDRTKLVDNFDKTFIAHFIPKK